MFIAESPSTAIGTGIRKANVNFKGTEEDNVFKKVRSHPKICLEECYTTDLVKCGRRARKPTMNKIDNCLNYLKQEIEIIKPKVIVAVGMSIVVEDGDKKVHNYKDFLERKLGREIHIIHTWHYSYVWNRCQLPRAKRDDPRVSQIRPDKWKTYLKQHEEIIKYLKKK